MMTKTYLTTEDDLRRPLSSLLILKAESYLKVFINLCILIFVHELGHIVLALLLHQTIVGITFINGSIGFIIISSANLGHVFLNYIVAPVIFMSTYLILTKKHWGYWGFAAFTMRNDMMNFLLTATLLLP